jgi:hypothetical protein
MTLLGTAQFITKLVNFDHLKLKAQLCQLSTADRAIGMKYTSKTNSEGRTTTGFWRLLFESGED